MAVTAGDMTTATIVEVACTRLGLFGPFRVRGTSGSDYLVSRMEEGSTVQERVALADIVSVVASNPPTGTYGSKSNVIVGPTGINLQAAGADMSGAIDAGPLLASVQSQLPSGGAGGGGDIYIPPGILKLSSADASNNGVTLTGQNARLIGAGRDATTIRLSQNGLTWGMALTNAQQELRDFTINVLSGTTAPFWLAGMPGVPGRSAQSCRFTRITANIASGATIPVPPSGPPNDAVHSAVGAGIFALGPDYPGTSTFDPGNAHFEECKAISQSTGVGTNLVSGYIIGNGTSGNVVAIYANDCQMLAVTYGIQLAGGGIRWYAGGSGGGCFDTDIYLQHGGGDPILFSGFRGENGNRVLWAGNIGATSPVVLEDCELGAYNPTATGHVDSPPAGQAIKWNAKGTLMIRGGHLFTTLANTTIGLCTDGGSLVTLVTEGFWVDTNPYPAANPARFLRYVKNAMVGTVDPAPLAGFQELVDGGVTLGADLRRSRQTPTEAVLVSGVDATAGELVSVTLSAARVVGAPLNPAVGQRLVFTLIQNGTGGWAATWNAVFKVSWSDTGNTASKRSSIAFLYDGTNWNQDGAQTPYV